MMKSVFAEIGSKERLRALLAGLYHKMQADPMIGFFFMHQDLDKLIDAQCHFYLFIFGQITTFDGTPPIHAHKKLPPLLEGHFNRRLVLLQETLREWGLSHANQAIWVAFESSFRDAIVHHA